MRLFFALEIPAPVQREIAAFMADLTPRLPAARWVRPEGLHLTLLFLGEVATDESPSEGTAPEPLEALCAAVRPCFARQPPVTLQVVGGGTFPTGRRARAAWLGVGGARFFAGLHRCLVPAAAAALGREPDERPFRPHVTLARPKDARSKEGWGRPACEQFRAAAQRRFGAPFRAERAVLLESRLGAGGARYRVVEPFALEGA
jgi:2'-5' RNA ligase